MVNWIKYLKNLYLNRPFPDNIYVCLFEYKHIQRVVCPVFCLCIQENIWIRVLNGPEN